MGVEELLRDSARVRLMRVLYAAGGPVREEFLTIEERQAADALEKAGLVIRIDSERLAANHDHRDATGIREWLRSRVTSGEVLVDVDADPLVSARHREFQELFGFIQDLTLSIMGCASSSELFDAAFVRLVETIEFDVAVSVMLEQNLDLYVCKRTNLERVVDERLVEKIRQSLQSRIPVSFETTDALVRTDRQNLPARPIDGDPLAHHIDTLLAQENRAAGILALYRAGEPFSHEEQRLLDVLSAQVSMVLENIRAQEKIRNLADTDELTGIWNRRAFRSRLPGEIERAKVYRFPLSLLMIDVDDFKPINDTWGHVIGDVVLSELCGTIRETLRTPDTFARFGGDEFAVILPHTDLWGARSVANRIVQRVRELEITTENGATIRCTISAGIASFVPPDMTASDLIQRADDRLLAAKKSGKDRITW